MYIYPEVATYTVNLTTVFDNGITESSVKNVVMKEPELEACFSASVTEGDAPLEVTFTDLTYGMHDTSWNFNDGTPEDSTKNPVHTFTIPNTYTVVLTVTGINGKTDTYQTDIKVSNPTPVALFTADIKSGKPPLKVKFTDQSTISFGEITTWYWKFGDGKSSTERNPVHEYSKIGNYTVELMVTSDKSRSNTYTRNGYISVTSGLAASFTADKKTGETPLTVKFTSKTPTGMEIKSYFWDFEDGTSSDPNPVHIYNFPGDYDVSLTVTNGEGESYTATEKDYISVINPAEETPATGTQTTGLPTYSETQEPVVTEHTPEKNGTRVFGIPGTEFFRSETVRIHGLYSEWLLLLKGLFGMG